MGRVQAEHGWQSKPDHERKDGEGEKDRNYHPRDASRAKRPREQCSPNGFFTGIKLGGGKWKPRPWEGLGGATGTEGFWENWPASALVC